jgi:hypothetical protein
LTHPHLAHSGISLFCGMRIQQKRGGFLGEFFTVQAMLGML